MAGASASVAKERTDSAARAACRKLLLVCRDSAFRLEARRCRLIARLDCLPCRAEPRRAVDLPLKYEILALRGATAVAARRLGLVTPPEAESYLIYLETLAGF